MAKRWSRDGTGRGALAAAMCCLALLPAACSAPHPQPERPSPPLTGGTAEPSGAPLSLLPDTIADSGAESAKPGGAPAAASPAPAAGAGVSAPPVSAYFVVVDDGGRQGIRFGCNDSLVGSARTGGTGDGRLEAAMSALLDGDHQEGHLYNALSGSRLKFLSGSFDGTTVTVYLAGTLDPNGTCDIPRIEAQLTQTALESVGAIRADIYINGEPLADYLKPGQSPPR